MEEDDKEFFILVLGVLAAVILVVSWWFTTGGVTTPTVQTATSASSQAADVDADDAPAADDDSAAGDDDGDHRSDDDDATSAADDADAADTTVESDGEDADDAGEDAAPAAPAAPTVFDAIAGNPDLSVVRDLLRDADLDQVLASGGPYTVFAPSNDAITKAAGSDTTVSVLENDRDTVLNYHVVAGAYTREELIELAQDPASAELTTVQGESITLAFDADVLSINGGAAVAPDSLDTGNGRVHTLDDVLIPPVAALNTLVGLEPILFATGSADIQPESFVTLDRFIDVLNTSTVNVTIEGHTDSSGNAILNQDLSQGRARSVVNYLVANGVDESRLTAVGFGPDRPVADNNTEGGRALNRRIEFTLG